MAPHRTTRLLLILAACLAAHSGAAARSDDAGDRALITANGLLRKGLFDLAIPEYQRALDADSADKNATVARYGLAVCLYRTGKPQQAGEQLDRIADQPFEFAADALLLRAHCALAQADYATVDRACADLARRFPEHASADAAALLRCEALYRLGRDPQNVAQAADDLASRFPRSPQRARAEFFAGIALAGADDHTAAARRFDWILQHAPDDDLAPRAGLLLAQSLEAIGQLARAEERYRRAAIGADPTLAPDAFLGLARMDLAAGRADDATRRIATILEDFPESPAAQHAALLAARIACDANRPADGLSALADRAFTLDLQDDAAFWTARCRLAEGRHTDAADLLRSALREFPDSELAPQMQFDLAVCLSRESKSPQALAAFEDLLRNHPDSPLAVEASFAIASTLQQQGEFERCQQTCRSLLRDNPEHPRAPEILLMLAECLYQQGDYADASAACARALAAQPAADLKSQLTYRMAMALYRDGAWAQARPLLESVVASSRTEPTALPALHALGSGYFASEQWLDAERVMTDYLRIDATGPLADDALLKQGLARQRQGREEVALESFDAIIDAYPDSVHRPQAIFERAQSLLALQRDAEAIAAFEEVVRAASDSRFAQPARERLGALAERSGDFTAAARWYDQAGGTQSTGAFDRGRALLASGDYQAAVDALTSAIQSSPSDPRAPSARAQRAIALARLARTDESLREIQSLTAAGDLSIDPALQRALRYEHAWILRDQGDTASAERLYRAFIDDPVADALRAHALVELGALLTESERWQEAYAALDSSRTSDRAALTAEPELAAINAYHMGICALRLGRCEEAASLLSELSTSATPRAIAASANLFCAEALMNCGRNSQAIERLTAALESGDDPQIARVALLRLGDASAAVSDWPASHSAFTRWLERFPNDPLWFQARFGIGWALQNQGNCDKAIESYRQIVASHEGPTAARAQFQIGECLYAQGLHEDAIREFIVVDALYAYPQWSAAALYEAGRCLHELGRADDARQRFEEVTERFPDSQWSGLAAEQLAAFPAPRAARQADVGTGVTQ